MCVKLPMKSSLRVSEISSFFLNLVKGLSPETSVSETGVILPPRVLITPGFAIFQSERNVIFFAKFCL